MKLMKKLIALCLALALLCTCALAESALEESQVLITVNDQEITVYDAEMIAYLLYYYGHTETYPDYDAALSYLEQQAVIEHHLRSAGYTDFDEETMSALRNDADAEWEGLLSDYVESNLTEDTEEQRAILRAQGEAYYASQNYDYDAILDELVLSAAQDVLEAELAGDYTPGEEEIDQVFQQYGAMYQQLYENDVQQYDYSVNYMGNESWYVPEGYRSVIHILLGDIDATLLNAYVEAQALYEEALSAETVDEAAVAEAKAAMDAAHAAVIASRQEDIDTIYARLENGETFESLIAEYGSDPGMENAETLQEGYPVHPQSVWCMPAFVEGAFQEGMNQPGDVSQPVISSYGIHILYYLRDLPSGLIMTDSIRAEIEEYLINSNLNTAYNAGYAEWVQEVTITRDEEAIAALKAEAQAY